VTMAIHSSTMAANQIVLNLLAGHALLLSPTNAPVSVETAKRKETTNVMTITLSMGTDVT